MDDDPPVASTSAIPDSDAVKTVEHQTAPGENKPAISKNQQKKLARAAKIAAERPARRAREKAARKENRAAKRKLVEEHGADPVAVGLHKKSRTIDGQRKPFDANIVIDLSFDDKMVEKEIKSMSVQLGHVYSVNRTAAHPMNVIFTPLNGTLRGRMDGTGGGHHLGWKRVTTLYTPLKSLWEPGPPTPVETGPSDQSREPDKAPSQAKGKEKVQLPVTKDSVVYLTADSHNVLTELKEGETYIIGGIVDHNRYKNLCLGIAQEHNIRHAALPIGQYIEMASRKILTVNQCFEIMHRWVEYRDWEKAFYEVIPSRKFSENRKSKTGEKGAEPENVLGEEIDEQPVADKANRPETAANGVEAYEADAKPVESTVA